MDKEARELDCEEPMSQIDLINFWNEHLVVWAFIFAIAIFIYITIRRIR